MSSFENHDLYQHLRYQPAHALIPIQSGARCRVCAALYNGNNKDPSPNGSLCGRQLCATYRPGDARVSALIGACCGLQDRFKSWCKRRPPVRPWEPLLFGAEGWWWEMVNVFHQQCEKSLVQVGPWLQDMLRQGWCSTLGGPIIDIWEIKITPTTYHHYMHCAFAIQLEDNSWWIFDPTGVQFGPDWPLLSPLNHYLARTESSLPRRRELLRFRSLGTSASWVRLGRKPW